MQTWDAIRARRNVRSYQTEPITAADLDRIAEGTSPGQPRPSRWSSPRPTTTVPASSTITTSGRPPTP